MSAFFTVCCDSNLQKASLISVSELAGITHTRNCTAQGNTDRLRTVCSEFFMKSFNQDLGRRGTGQTPRHRCLSRRQSPVVEGPGGLFREASKSWSCTERQTARAAHRSRPGSPRVWAAKQRRERCKKVGGSDCPALGFLHTLAYGDQEVVCFNVIAK